MKPKRILMATDFSDCAEVALTLAASCSPRAAIGGVTGTPLAGTVHFAVIEA